MPSECRGRDQYFQFPVEELAVRFGNSTSQLWHWQNEPKEVPRMEKVKHFSWLKFFF
jgi:hypothetical protein